MLCFCFQPPTLIANLSTFPERERIKKVVPKLPFDERKLFFLFCFIAQIIFKYLTSVLYTLVSYLLYIRFANQNLSLSLSFSLSLSLINTWLVDDWCIWIFVVSLMKHNRKKKVFSFLSSKRQFRHHGWCTYFYSFSLEMCSNLQSMLEVGNRTHTMRKLRI